MNQYCVRWWWLHLPLLAAIWLAPQLDAQALPNEPCHGNYIPGEYLVKFNEDYLTGNGAGGERAVRDRKAMRLAQLAASLEIAQVRREYSLVRGLRQVKAIGTELRGDQVERLIREGKIEYAIPNCVRYIRGRERFPSAVPNDPRLSELWGLNSTSGYSVNAPLAWNIATGSTDIVVGVVDTGVDYLHEDLAANMWTNPGEVAANGLDDDGNGVADDVYGYNAVNNSGDPRDDDIDASHGSHCAGTIGAVGNNGVGVVGVNWTTKIMALKFINGLTGSGSIGDELAALDYAATMKQRGVNLRVLSNSYGALEETFIPERQAIEELNSLGVLFVAAAGNEGNNNDIVGNYPSNYDVANIIAVAALNENGTLADFSNFGATSVDLGAPGVNILSTHRYQGYALLSGTSMATPHVAGVAALVLSQTPELTVAQLKDVLMDTVTPISSLSGTMVAPGMVNAFGALTESESLCSISGDTFTPPTLPSGDSDSDGVTDVMELSDGSDPSDPGSFRLHLVSPVYAPWTGFLGITGILELVNVGDTSAVATVTLYKIDGTACSRVSVSIDALGQRDLIINDMQGFETDSYGILKIEFTGNVDGRVFHYRSGAVSSTYDFAFGVPLANATFGNTAVSFNTFQPSLAISEQSNIVPNWLSIVNLSSATKSFSIGRYDQSGTLLSTTSVQVAARGRADIEAGHVTPGPGNVGVNVIVPTDAQAPYISFLTRFGYNVPPGQNPTGYEFAFPLLSRAGNGRPMHVPLSSTLSGQNWVEVINTSDSSTAFDIEFRRSNGALIGLASVSLPAHAQHHFDATSLLGAEQTGFATITPSAVNSIVAQSMFYVRNPSDGSVLAMYGSQAREAFGSAIHGSYNLYLGMLNWLKLLNPTTSAVTATVRVNHAAGSATEIISVPAKNSFDLDIHNSLRWGTAADSYGVIEVSVAPADTLLVEDLRMRTEPGGLTDFLAPTEVR